MPRPRGAAPRRRSAPSSTHGLRGSVGGSCNSPIQVPPSPPPRRPCAGGRREVLVTDTKRAPVWAVHPSGDGRAPRPAGAGAFGARGERPGGATGARRRPPAPRRVQSRQPGPTQGHLAASPGRAAGAPGAGGGPGAGQTQGLWRLSAAGRGRRASLGPRGAPAAGASVGLAGFQARWHHGWSESPAAPAAARRRRPAARRERSSRGGSEPRGGPGASCARSGRRWRPRPPTPRHLVTAVTPASAHCGGCHVLGGHLWLECGPKYVHPFHLIACDHTEQGLGISARIVV